MTRRAPCRACPWKVDATADQIPGFRLDKAEALVSTCPTPDGEGPGLGDPMFACHQSREGAEVACAGWLAVAGHAHVGARLAAMSGRIDAEALAEPPEDWPELHGTFGQVIAKLRATDPESK